MPENRHELYLTPEFASRFDQIEKATIAGDASAAQVYEEIVRMMRDLEDGTEKGSRRTTAGQTRTLSGSKDGPSK